MYHKVISTTHGLSLVYLYVHYMRYVLASVYSRISYRADFRFHYGLFLCLEICVLCVATWVWVIVPKGHLLWKRNKIFLCLLCDVGPFTSQMVSFLCEVLRISILKLICTLKDAVLQPRFPNDKQGLKNKWGWVYALTSAFFNVRSICLHYPLLRSEKWGSPFTPT